jgi:hypothetical protein
MSTGVTRWDCTFYRKLGLYVTGKLVFGKVLTKGGVWLLLGMWQFDGDEKNMDKGRCPLCLDKEDIIHTYYWIILKLDNWRMTFLNYTW